MTNPIIALDRNNNTSVYTGNVNNDDQGFKIRNEGVK